MTTPPQISQFISEGIVTIARIEYPGQWLDLTRELVGFLNENDHDKNLRVWQLIEEITDKYPLEERSDPLYYEINVTLDSIHDKLLYYCQGYLNQLEAVSDQNLLLNYLHIYRCLLRIFYNINSQDLPACIEDNLSNWSKILKDTLQKVVNTGTGPKKEDADGLWFECKGEAIKSALLFATKYREDFMEAIQPFAQEIWKVCMDSTNDEKYEKILINSMKYFKCFCENPNFIDFFSTNLNLLFTKVLIPNLQPNEGLQSLFEDQPEAFIENLTSNKETDERAETCISFIRSLSRFQNEKVEETLKVVIGEYIANMNGAPNPANEIVCINLICFAAVTGCRLDYGVIEINMHKELVFSTYESLVKPRLGPIFQAIAKEEVEARNRRTCRSCPSKS